MTIIANFIASTIKFPREEYILDILQPEFKHKNPKIVVWRNKNDDKEKHEFPKSFIYHQRECMSAVTLFSTHPTPLMTEGQTS